MGALQQAQGQATTKVGWRLHPGPEGRIIDPHDSTRFYAMLVTGSPPVISSRDWVLCQHKNFSSKSIRDCENRDETGVSPGTVASFCRRSNLYYRSALIGPFGLRKILSKGKLKFVLV